MIVSAPIYLLFLILLQKLTDVYQISSSLQNKLIKMTRNLVRLFEVKRKTSQDLLEENQLQLKLS